MPFAHWRLHLAEALVGSANEASHGHPHVDRYAGGRAVLAAKANDEAPTKTSLEGQLGCNAVVERGDGYATDAAFDQIAQNEGRIPCCAEARVVCSVGEH